MATDLCAVPFTRLRDVPCGCDAPPLQCEVTNFGDLPACPDPLHPSPPAPANTPIENGDVYVVINGAGGSPQPFFFWDCNWYPLAPVNAGDADWFVEGVGGPDYGLGLNTDTAYHEGPAAIGRTTARVNSTLDVTGQIVADGTHTGTSDVPVSGTGTRFMWLPETSSIRAGVVASTEWDNANIGEYSAAFNFANIASGLMAFAAGRENVASGRFSTCFGASNVASNDHAFAAGSSNVASGDDSFVAGARNSSTGPRSFAFGDDCLSTDLRSTAIGGDVQARAQGCFAVGENIELTAAATYTVLFGNAVGLSRKTYTQSDSFIVHRLRTFLHTPNTAPTDTDIDNSHMSIWIDEGTNQLKFRSRDSGGTLRTGSVTLV